MKLLNKKALIFDLDGCLLDTSSGIRESVNYTLSALGLAKLNNDDLIKFIGPPIQISLMDYCNLSSDEAQNGANLFREYYKEKALLKAELYPRIKETLNEFRKRGIKMAVATYKREDYAIKLLKAFDLTEYFDTIHGGDNNNKLSKGDIIKLCLSDLNCTNKDAIMIGDTVNDARGAKALEMDFIGVTWGFGFKAKHKSNLCESIVCIDNPTQLLTIIKD